MTFYHSAMGRFRMATPWIERVYTAQRDFDSRWTTMSDCSSSLVLHSAEGRSMGITPPDVPLRFHDNLEHPMPLLSRCPFILRPPSSERSWSKTYRQDFGLFPSSWLVLPEYAGVGSFDLAVANFLYLSGVDHDYTEWAAWEHGRLVKFVNHQIEGDFRDMSFDGWVFAQWEHFYGQHLSSTCFADSRRFYQCPLS